MNSDLKRQISAENGKKSRGPKTLAGKLNSRRNALKHGRTCKELIPHNLSRRYAGEDKITRSLLTLDTESPDTYIRVLAALTDQIQPETELETQLVESIAHARWRTMRTWTQEKAVLDHAMREATQASSDPNLPATDCSGIALKTLADTSNVLTCIDRHENRFYRIYHRSLRELNQLKKRSKNEQTNLSTPTKQTTGQKTNLMANRIPSQVLEARMKAHQERESSPDPAI